MKCRAEQKIVVHRLVATGGPILETIIHLIFLVEKSLLFENLMLSLRKEISKLFILLC